jgi:hypothetical protein
MKLKSPKISSILLYYSIIFSTILIIGGFYTARSGKEIISNLLFLPVVVFLWTVLIKDRQEKKSQTKQIQKSKIKMQNEKNF